jgi:hypothetical protein
LAAINTDLQGIGSRYAYSSGGSVLPGFTSGTMEFSDTASLSVSGSNQLDKSVLLTSANALLITNPGTDTAKVTIKATTGFFSGSFLYPGHTTPTAFGGVLLQDGTHCGGFFLGPNGSGKVSIGPP